MSLTARPDPVVGWRAWRIQDDGRLRAVWSLAIWRSGVNVAHCGEGDHAPPALQTPCLSPSRGRCTCGFHAFWDFELAWDLAGDISTPCVLGLAMGWGTVALHGSEGWRATHARVVCLLKDLPAFKGNPPTCDTDGWATWRALVQKVADDYGVPCLRLADAACSGFLGEMGVKVPMDLVDEWCS